MRVEPDHADARTLCRVVPRGSCDGSARERVVAPQQQREAAGAERGRRLIGDALANIRDRPEETRAALRSALRVLAEGNRHVSRVFDRMSDSLEPFAQVRVSNREWTHVDATAARAEVHRHANDPDIRHALWPPAAWKRNDPPI